MNFLRLFPIALLVALPARAQDDTIVLPQAVLPFAQLNQPPVEPNQPGLEPRDQVIELPNAELVDVIAKWQELTGDNLIVSTAAQGTFNILSNPESPMTATEAIDFLQSNLLLNGLAIIPYKPGISKLISWSANQPVQEGIETYTSLEGFPEDERIVNYIMKLENITPEEAIASFTSAVPNHSFGGLTPVENARILIIRDTSTVVRALVEFQKSIDVPSANVTDKMIVLERADAEEVAGIINEILSAQSSQRSNSGGARRISAGNAAAQLANAAASGGDASPAGLPDESDVIVSAIPRLNSILVIASPNSVAYIERLVQKLDSPAEFKNLLQRQLRFIPVSDFLPVAGDALNRGGVEEVTQGQATGGTGGAGGTRSLATTTRGNQGLGASGTSSSGLGGFGGSTGTGVGGRTSTAGGSSFQGTGESFQPPVSLIVGKTLLIADPQSNTLIVSGPPENLQTIDELIDVIDKRPRQVYISAIVAQVTLGDDIQYGVDVLRKVESFDVNGTPVDAAGIFNTITNGTGIIDPTLLDQIQGFSDAGLLGAGGLNTYAAVGEFFNAYVRALENTNNFKVLARPTVYTANNSPARLSSGQRVPVPTSQQSTVVAGGTQSLNSNIEYQEVVLELNVKPLINSSDEVTLEISQVNDNITGFTVINNDQIPNISTQQLETFVNVPNGAVVVIGGLIQESQTKTTSGLPIVAKIPILKHLFGSNTNQKTRSELLIFIQPQIIETTADLVDANLDLDRRTIVGDEAQAFAQPPIKIDQDLRVPTWQPGADSPVYRTFEEVEAERRAAGFERKLAP